MKVLDQGVADIIMAYADEELEPGLFFGTAALAPFHDLTDMVPDEVQAELIEVAEGLVSGEIETGYGM
jgi:basic membrane protein A